MEKVQQVFESPDYPKTIEEINDDIEPKSFPSIGGLVSKPAETPLQDVFRFFENLTQAPPSAVYVSERSSGSTRFTHIAELETELLEVQKELASNSAYDSKEQLHKLASDLAAQLTSIKERAHTSVEIGSCKWRSTLGVQVQPLSLHSSESATYEIVATRSAQDLQLRQRLYRLEERLKQIERALGDWKRSKSVCETVGFLLHHVQMMNSSLLEHIENQSKNLGTDLDLLFSASKSEFQLDKETVQALTSLQGDTVESFTSISALPALADRAAALRPLQDLTLKLNDRIRKLEELSNGILSSASEQTDLCAVLRTSIEENQEIVRRNLTHLSL